MLTQAHVHEELFDAIGLGEAPAAGEVHAAHRKGRWRVNGGGGDQDSCGQSGASCRPYA